MEVRCDPVLAGSSSHSFSVRTLLGKDEVSQHAKWSINYHNDDTSMRASVSELGYMKHQAFCCSIGARSTYMYDLIAFLHDLCVCFSVTPPLSCMFDFVGYASI